MSTVKTITEIPMLEVMHLLSTIKGVSFVAIKGYENKAGEVQNVLLNVGVSYEKAVQKDIKILTNLDVNKMVIAEGSDFDVLMLEEARTELLKAKITPSKNQSEAQKNAYTHIFSGIKKHNENGTFYFYGLKVENSKKVLIEGEYKEDKRKPLTKAKDEIRKLLHSDNYRTYTVNSVEGVTLKGKNIIL